MGIFGYNLERGGSKLVQAVKNSYPDLKKDEIEEACNILLEHISEHIAQGQQLTFWTVNSDGKPVLNIVGIRLIDQNLKR